MVEQRKDGGNPTTTRSRASGYGDRHERDHLDTGRAMRKLASQQNPPRKAAEAKAKPSRRLLKSLTNEPLPAKVS